MRGIQRSLVPVLLIVRAVLWAQSQPSFIYVESFRKGPTKIMEQTLEVDLDPGNPTCNIRVRDQSGRDRYQFMCTPQRVGSGDDRIIAWQVTLADKQHRIYGNVLMASPDPTQDRTQVGWLDPGKFAKIALTTERVVKVDHFYCVFQVTDSHFVAPGQPYLDHMTVNIKFTNTMPHSAVRAKKDDKAPS
jgi:hypothetical protein